MANLFKQIDGSCFEGGGQILRISTVLSSLLNTPVEIKNIRAGRPRPGLAAQHLHGLLLARDITQGELIGGEIGSTNVQFIPRKISSGTFTVHIQTAGSVTLILQTAIPILLYSNSSSFLKLHGGTHVPFAPFLDFFTEVLPAYLPFLRKTKTHCERFGFFPKGGGQVTFHLEPLDPHQPLPSIECLEFGELSEITGFVLVSGRLPISLGQINAKRAYQTIEQQRLFLSRDHGQSHKKNQPIHINFRKEPLASDGVAIMLVGKTTTDCRLSASVLAQKNDMRSDSYGCKVAEKLIKELQDQPTVDQHVQDQLIIYMALALGRSRILAGELTLHTKTAIWVTELFTGVKFDIKPWKNLKSVNLNLIECEGIGYIPEKYYPT